jgi:hypothetical protein
MSDTPSVPPPPPAPTPTPPAPASAPVAPAKPAVGGKVFLAIAAALFLGWLGWLSYTALTKSRAPVVSRAQAAAATVPVRATLTVGSKDLKATHERAGPNNTRIINPLQGDDGKPAFVADVVEKLHPNGPDAGTKIGVWNLPASAGYTGPGEYLLLLNRDGLATIDTHPAYILVGQQRSPGADLHDVGPPVIYPWTPQTDSDLRKQVARLFPRKD